MVLNNTKMKKGEENHMDEKKMEKKGRGLMFELLCIVLVPVVFIGAFCLLSLRNV